ncbi:protein kinase domain protein [Ichthyophthirius multifiliis]|uniref:Protein kinase domain protein n=1 Tax=Ichthyophthirius multifiliis TaxID=5932 RepID=G0QUW2_ICHMU|nr:protein kinase domain protein [Ichthyophthirius multifiliis]EGR30967.1 protein kinase domain protein [Ichthyophthirius multifiliis]|eukprot:XP_004034422.1 protein kinase domain protein [Ichthyophthirius multifiliis]
MNLENEENKEFKIEKQISSGAFGNIFKAIRLKDLQIFAIKTLYFGNDKNKILREINNLELLKGCKNVVQLIQYNIFKNKCQIILEYVPYDLKQYLENSYFPLSHSKVWIKFIKKIQYIEILNLLIYQQLIISRQKQVIWDLLQLKKKDNIRQKDLLDGINLQNNYLDIDNMIIKLISGVLVAFLHSFCQVMLCLMEIMKSNKYVKYQIYQEIPVKKTGQVLFKCLILVKLFLNRKKDKILKIYFAFLMRLKFDFQN